MARPSRKRRQDQIGSGDLPQHLDLLLGWRSAAQVRTRIGFISPSEANPVGEEPILYEEDRHLLTIAPTGAGKGRGVIIPNLLRFQGSAIVIDPKGETWHVTRRRREEMGQAVCLLDPFGATSAKETHSLNPFDLFDRPGALLDADSEMLASLLAGDLGFHKEPFWDNWGRSLMAGVIAAVAQSGGGLGPRHRHFGRVRELLMTEDAIYNLGLLIEGEDVNRLSRQNISSFLPITEQTRSGILSTAQSYLKVVNSDAALASLEDSKISLSDLRDGKPMTIYIVVPPDKLESHSALLRLWVGVLLLTVMGRKRRPSRSTLFLLDEAAQLGEFAPLRQAMTLLRGYGLQVWPFFQDLSQMQRLYPKDWRTIFNNAGVFQVFGVPNHLMARETADLIGDIDAPALRALPRDQQVVAVSGETVFTCRVPDYLRDQEFKGLYDPNPMFAHVEPATGKTPGRRSLARSGAKRGGGPAR